MRRLTLNEARPIVAAGVNMCASDARVRDLINEAQSRLLSKGQWVGSMQTYRICVSGTGCLVWPRQVESIEAWSLCDSPGTLRNRWYQFTNQGPGQLTERDNWFTTMIDRDPVCAFNEIGSDSLTKKIQVSVVSSESGSQEICLQGYDENAQWIRTTHGGLQVDGEYLTISNTPTLSTRFFTKLTGVQKPITNGPVVLSEYETANGLGVVQTLAFYENDETNPIYRASFLPGLPNQHGCNSCQPSDCSSNQVTVFVKLRHLDVINDPDWLILQNPYALRFMAQAILKERNNLFNEAQAYEAKAVSLLQDDLSTQMGDGELPTINREGSGSWGGGVIPPLGYAWPIGY